jgi:ClpX C4-type zinc finger
MAAEGRARPCVVTPGDTFWDVTPQGVHALAQIRRAGRRSCAALRRLCSRWSPRRLRGPLRPWSGGCGPGLMAPTAAAVASVSAGGFGWVQPGQECSSGTGAVGLRAGPECPHLSCHCCQVRCETLGAHRHDCAGRPPTGLGFAMFKRSPPRRKWIDGSARCSFCGRARSDVDRRIAGPGVNICKECVGLCNEILEAEQTPAR